MKYTKTFNSIFCQKKTKFIVCLMFVCSIFLNLTVNLNSEEHFNLEGVSSGQSQYLEKKMHNTAEHSSHLNPFCSHMHTHFCHFIIATVANYEPIPIAFIKQKMLFNTSFLYSYLFLFKKIRPPIV